MKLEALAPATQRARFQQWSCYRRFCIEFNLKPIPCSNDQLSWYVTHLMKFMTHGSIVNYIQAVLLGHKFRGVTPPVVSSAPVKLALAGVKRVGLKSLKSRDPVTIPILLLLFNSLKLSLRSHIMFWACCLLLFRSLLRVSHVVSSPHTLHVSDVCWEKNGIVLAVKSSKTSTSLRCIPISICKDRRLCAVHWLRRWLRVSGLSKSDYLFATNPGCPMSYSLFSSTLEVFVNRAGVQQNITSHSSRHGGTSFLSELGLPLSKIKDRGGWKSNAVYCYLSDSMESKWLVDQKVSNLINNYSSC